MTRVSLEQSEREISSLWDRAKDARRALDFERALAVHQELLDHPCAHHTVDAAEVHEERHLTLRALGRFDEAIAAKRQAIDAGYRSVPDPEADVAECLVEAGRLDEAAALFAELKERDPGDVWLYNSAGMTYKGVDDQESLRWLLGGIEVAIATGDPDQVIAQLVDIVGMQWRTLGMPEDSELLARVEAFEDSWSRPAWGPPSYRQVDVPEQRPRPCSHCMFDPEPPPEPLRPRHHRAQRHSMALSVGWFPTDEWPEAQRVWPDPLADLPDDHRDYSRYIEGRLKWLSRDAPGVRYSVSPLTVAELMARGDTDDEDGARAALAREILSAGRALPWPPGRNDPCWCGSGDKYKRCCGPAPIVGSDD